MVPWLHPHEQAIAQHEKAIVRDARKLARN
jgi:hypothetical protein